MFTGGSGAGGQLEIETFFKKTKNPHFNGEVSVSGADLDDV